jgi:midasin
VVTPHPNFRLFFAMDPAHGEISRAMRNRGVELFVEPLAVPSRDAAALICAAGVPGTSCQDWCVYAV